jgi:hypothetical protein
VQDFILLFSSITNNQEAIMLSTQHTHVFPRLNVEVDFYFQELHEAAKELEGYEEEVRFALYEAHIDRLDNHEYAHFTTQHGGVVILDEKAKTVWYSLPSVPGARIGKRVASRFKLTATNNTARHAVELGIVDADIQADTLDDYEFCFNCANRGCVWCFGEELVI